MINSIAGVVKADVTVLKEDSNRILDINTTNIIYTTIKSSFLIMCFPHVLVKERRQNHSQ